jgi:hypothetical protein
MSTHTHPKQRRHFLDISVFCRVHIQRTAAVNTSCGDSRKMKKVAADGSIKNLKKQKQKNKNKNKKKLEGFLGAANTVLTDNVN